jgi:hypothetical protein
VRAGGPTASNLNFLTGQNIPNLVTAKLSADGRICIFSYAATHVIADVAGYFGAGADGGFLDGVPSRVLDSRTPGVGKVTSNEYRLDLDLRDLDVGADVAAAALNVTVTQPDDAGFVTVFPCDEPRPTASNVNYVRGQTVPNAGTVKVAADGTLCIYSLAPTHVIVDLAGLYTAGGFYEPTLRTD